MLGHFPTARQYPNYNETIYLLLLSVQNKTINTHFATVMEVSKVSYSLFICLRYFDGYHGSLVSLIIIEFRMPT